MASAQDKQKEYSDSKGRGNLNVFKQEHEKAVRLLGLTTSDDQRFFEPIHASPNTMLFGDNFRMDAQAFDALFKRCKPFISDTVRDQRELLAVTLSWIGTAATAEHK
ncbi:Pol protein, partial [Phytophthora palmivora]